MESENKEYLCQPQPRRIFPKNVDFDKYVEENCKNKFKILDRSTFHQIKSPIIIFFNHFHEKCVYHTKWLDQLQQLASKYDKDIEFIAADFRDIDVIDPIMNPYDFICSSVTPEDATPRIYVINENKCIYEHSDPSETIEDLYELCENLLNDKLFKSQPIPLNDGINSLKIGVYKNYEELVLHSKKDIFLIVDMGDCQLSQEDYETDYENIALKMKDYNLDIVYMDAEENYIPYEYIINDYPTFAFIPHNDKHNVIYYEGYRGDEYIIEFLKEVLEDRLILKLKQEEEQQRQNRRGKSVMVPQDFEMDFNDLQQYLQDNFENSIKVLNRDVIKNQLSSDVNISKCIIIAYMNFQGEKCLAHHIRWLDKIHKIAGSYTNDVEYLVADFKDIDIINTKWKQADFINNISTSEDEIPKIFAIDCHKHTYEFKNFTTMSSLHYFKCSLSKGDFYYSECVPGLNNKELVKTCVAHNLHNSLKQSENDVFITFYQPDQPDSSELLTILEDIAHVVKEFKVEIIKFNVKDNYLDLEYASDSYPVHYFISHHNKNEQIIYRNENLNKTEMLEFIMKNVRKN